MAYQWGMVVDLDRCTGCGACVVACQAENNVPVVGEQGSVQGRGHYWIRVERYWEGEYPNIRAKFIPVLCQQCHSAPCEPVCPVFATYHNPEGLNTQIYNRCVGIRYCAQNCPYKVRYFNWFAPEWPDPLQNQLNPEVTVRSRGIMEKCTFCIQRIRRAKEKAKAQDRQVREGEIQPACVQVCPPSALVFGDLNDPSSLVARLSQDKRGYRLLEELGTEPAVVYLSAGGPHAKG